jgi:tRNA-specific 2-thiouridylase
MRFYVANYTDEFRREIIEPWADAYLQGETPNPCVSCNRRFKFDRLLERARVLGASKVVSGHYARIDRDATTGALRLLRARRRDKDQSYFLFQLDQRQLGFSWFPLGELDKQEVRARARELGLATADKPESFEICFVPDRDYATVLERIRPEAADAGGAFVDVGGRVLGRHPGVHHYTIGQRKGLGIASGGRLHVVEIRAESRQVVLGDASDLDVKRARVERASWIAGAPPREPLRARVRVRARHEGTFAWVEPYEREGRAQAWLHFDEPVRALAPGQAAVFEQDDVVLGGGFLTRPTT